MIARRSMYFLVLLLALGGMGTTALRAQTTDRDPYQKFHDLTATAPEAYVAGDKAAAVAQANELLLMAPAYREDWNYGNAIHAAYLVLGRIALDAGRVSEAREYLFKSVTSIARTQTDAQPPQPPDKASPQMDSFGPDMAFAKDLLAKGEKDAVLKYLALCANFWRNDDGKLVLWRKQINAGETPNFGRNVIYFFPEEAAGGR